ncbi:uncharacterized protein METZ01_LOCUS148630, partial [marine metagenome]
VKTPRHPTQLFFLCPDSARFHSDPQLGTRRTVDSWVWLGATEGG